MQLDYYRSPCCTVPQEGVRPSGGAPLPGDGERPRRRRAGLAVLIVFAALILASAAGIVALHFLAPEEWKLSLDRFTPDTWDPGFHYEGPDDFYGSFDMEWDQSSAPTTIPRAAPAPGVQLRLSDLPERVMSFQEIYEKVLPSIVSIQAYSDFAGYEGTGVILTVDGYIITNHHVIAGCSSAEVVLSDGTWYDAKLVGSDAESDLAVLKIDAQGLTPAEFGDSDRLRVGDAALAIGNPLGSELFGTMTEGIVSAINRDVRVEGYDMSLIQTTAALNPGNSGGALVNDAGQVVGITNMKMMSGDETIEGLGFAIPTTWVRDVVNALLEQGAITGRPTIGFTCMNALPGNGRDSGVYVNKVTPRGPAEQAGVQSGDIVIAANGETIENMDDLLRVRDETGVGGEMELTVWRDGEVLELTLTLVDQYELN